MSSPLSTLSISCVILTLSWTMIGYEGSSPAWSAQRFRRLNIVMEVCDMDLASYLSNRNGQKLPEDDIWHYFIQISLGLHEVHSHKVYNPTRVAESI